MLKRISFGSAVTGVLIGLLASCLVRSHAEPLAADAGYLTFQLHYRTQPENVLLSALDGNDLIILRRRLIADLHDRTNCVHLHGVHPDPVPRENFEALYRVQQEMQRRATRPQDPTIGLATERNVRESAAKESAKREEKPSN